YCFFYFVIWNEEEHLINYLFKEKVYLALTPSYLISLTEILKILTVLKKKHRISVSEFMTLYHRNVKLHSRTPHKSRIIPFDFKIIGSKVNVTGDSFVNTLSVDCLCSGGEKMTLSISVLLAQSVFLLLISQRLPSHFTSLLRYLVFIMVLVTVVVLNCVVVLNLHFRALTVCVLVQFFLERLPEILRMSRPAEDEPMWDGALPRRASSVGYITAAEEYYSIKSCSELMSERHGFTKWPTHTPQEEDGVTEQLYGEIKPAVVEANYIIINHMHNKNDYNEVKGQLERDCVDCLCLFLITLIMTLDTIIIFLTGICNYPPRLPFKGDPHDYTNNSARLLRNY
uniref:Cholinergic receptor, nicotinic, delta (muscle) n=1 Tax=Kryptolebias marmoratus TaxID=37003 RepID=A0A3Q3A8X6_KRYMA